MFGFLKKKGASAVIAETAESSKSFTNTVGMEFVYLDGGKFTMGRNGYYKEGGDVESPSHEVKIKGFWIAKYPVTQEQYVRLTRVNPSFFKNDKVLEETSKKHPVERVSWFDAKAFVELLNRYEGKHGIYALPTEAQWEYAVKAGGNTRFTFGDSEAMLDDYATYALNAMGKTSEVDTKAPNRLGIASMLGNVWEWCEDDFFANYSGAPADGSAWRSKAPESFKVRRGGSYKTDYLCLRSSFRGYARPDIIADDTGFRIVINGDPFS